MTDHRGIQRTLFRMQADARFARAIYARDRAALASTKLGASDVDLLTQTHPEAVAADPGGRRRTQVFGNAASEFTLTLGAATCEENGAALFEGFMGCDEFHMAMANEGRLPLAFAAFARRRVEELGARNVAAVLALESAMTELRREAPEIAPDRDAGQALRLSPRVRLISLPAGTLDWAGALRSALDEDRAVEPGALSFESSETVLLQAREGNPPYRLPEIGVELVPAPADEFLLAANGAVSSTDRAAFARRHGATPEDFERYLDGLVADRVLLRTH